MRIEIFASGDGSVVQMQSSLNNLHSDICATIQSLQNVNTKINNINGGVQRLADAVNGIQERIRTENAKKISLEAVSKQAENFLNNTAQTDSLVAKKVIQNTDNFFNKYTWLRPATPKEKSWWQQCVDDWNNFWDSVDDTLESVWEGIVEFVKEHAVELIIGAVAIVVGAALAVLTGGAFFPALLAGLKLATISGLVSGGISAGILGVISIIKGDDGKTILSNILKGFSGGLASGFMMGGISFGLSSIFQFAAYSGATTGRSGGIGKKNVFKILSPDKFPKHWAGQERLGGGTLIKIGKNLSLDVDLHILTGTKLPKLLHLHLPNFNSTIPLLGIHGGHIPVGYYYSILKGVLSGGNK